MIGKLKNTDFYIGHKMTYTLPQKGNIVDIIDTEDHFIYGKRYRIKGNNDWFESNCFEWVEA